MPGIPPLLHIQHMWSDPNEHGIQKYSIGKGVANIGYVIFHMFLCIQRLSWHNIHGAGSDAFA